MARSKVLYVSSAIGLGHVSKDVAIANELRLLRPDADLHFLAGHPASEALAGEGESVLPESAEWRGGTVIAERTMRNGQLNLVRYAYRSLPAWAHNMLLLRRIVRDYSIDLVVGDEAWEIDVPLILHVLRLRIPFVLITDFVGMDVVKPTVVDHLGAYLLNVLWSQDRRIYTAGRHSAIFIGELEDIPDEPLGHEPSRRGHARATYDVVGHVIRFRPEDYADRAEVRRRLGYDERPLVICSAGGTALGRGLLQRCADAYPLLRERLPDVRMVLVCGPRIPTESLEVPAGVELRAYVPNLFEHHACCDVAVTQCGASTTTELAALRIPFVYFPIEGHFEQELVAARLARYGAGARMSLNGTTPAMLADAIAYECGHRLAYPALPVEGARNAARHIASRLQPQPR